MYTVVVTTRKGFMVHCMEGHKQAFGIYNIAIETPGVRACAFYGDAGLIIDERFPELRRKGKVSDDAAAVLRNSGLHPKG